MTTANTKDPDMIPAPTFAEIRLTPEKRLEIAEAVAARFNHPDNHWHQGNWCAVRLPVSGRTQTSELDTWQQDGANCFCLTAAIRIETQLAIPEIQDIYNAGGCDEAMALIYTRAAGIGVTIPSEPGPHGDPAIDTLIAWNDAPGRTFHQVRLLVSTVAALCRADLPIDWTGRRILSADKDLAGIVIEASRGVELKIKWDHLDEPVWWDIDEFEDDQALLLQIGADTLVRLDRRSVLASPNLSARPQDDRQPPIC